MTDRLTGIEARLDAATPGPWELERYSHGGGRIWARSASGIRRLIADTFEGKGNRELLFAAPTDIAALLGAVKEVRELANYLDTLAPGDQHYAKLIRAAIAKHLEARS